MRKIILYLIKKIPAIRYMLHATRYTLLAVLFLASCASPERKFPDIVWPPPPDEPKIKFVEILQSNLDVEETGFITALLGEEVRAVLEKPYGVAIDSEGRVYVSDLGRVFVFDKNNKKLSFIGWDATGGGKLRLPSGIAISRDGKVYVADTASDKVFVYDKDGTYLNDIGHTGEFTAPSGVALDEKRRKLYVADAKKHNITAYSLDGKFLHTIGKRGNNAGEFNFPTSIALDSSGNLYVVDTGNFRVQVFDSSGKHIKMFGELGDRPGNFVRPKGIAFDSEDNIYIVDAAFQNFQVFSKEGRLLTFVGNGGEAFGQFSVPAGMAIDGNDMIYVVDQLNRRVQVFQYMSEKWKKRQAEQPKR